MWEPFTKSILKWVPDCKIVFDKFHVMQHANAAVDEVRRAEFFRKGVRRRAIVKGKLRCRPPLCSPLAPLEMSAAVWWLTSPMGSTMPPTISSTKGHTT